MRFKSQFSISVDYLDQDYDEFHFIYSHNILDKYYYLVFLKECESDTKFNKISKETMSVDELTGKRVVALRQIEFQNEFEKNQLELTLQFNLKNKITESLTERLVGESSSSNAHTKWAYVFRISVHHKYYRDGLMAWDYPNEDLMTLCWECHEELHLNSKVQHFDIFGNLKGDYSPCIRCYGLGYLPEYNHIDHGVCFRCNGARYEELINT
jgi:hypothetical protein